MSSLTDALKSKAMSFQAGQLKRFASEWEKLTSHGEILEMVNGIKLDFDSQIVRLHSLFLAQPRLTEEEMAIIDVKVDKLHRKGVISPSEPEREHFVSPTFSRPMKDESHRMILVLEQVNSIPSFQDRQAAVSLETSHTKLFYGSY